MIELCPKCGAKRYANDNPMGDWKCGSFQLTLGGIHQTDTCRIAELQSQVKAWADAALESLAGLTPTPEQGYLKDGGVEQFRADAARMRREMGKESAWQLTCPGIETVEVAPEGMMTADEAEAELARRFGLGA